MPNKLIQQAVRKCNLRMRLGSAVADQRAEVRFGRDLSTALQLGKIMWRMPDALMSFLSDKHALKVRVRLPTVILASVRNDRSPVTSHSGRMSTEKAGLVNEVPV